MTPMFRHALAVAALLAAPMVPALAQTPPAPAPAPAAMPDMPGTSSGQSEPGVAKSPADSQMMSDMAKMNEAMTGAPMTGNPDRDFVLMMMPHHQGAVAMAQVELKYGKDPGLRRMATDIVTSQRKEIGEMQRWQARHPVE